MSDKSEFFEGDENFVIQIIMSKTFKNIQTLFLEQDIHKICLLLKTINFD